MKNSFILMAMFIALCSIVISGPAGVVTHGIPYERIEIDRPVVPIVRNYGHWGHYGHHGYGRGVGWNGAYYGGNRW